MDAKYLETVRKIENKTKELNSTRPIRGIDGAGGRLAQHKGRSVIITMMDGDIAWVRLVGRSEVFTVSIFELKVRLVDRKTILNKYERALNRVASLQMKRKALDGQIEAADRYAGKIAEDNELTEAELETVVYPNLD